MEIPRPSFKNCQRASEGIGESVLSRDCTLEGITVWGRGGVRSPKGDLKPSRSFWKRNTVIRRISVVLLP